MTIGNDCFWPLSKPQLFLIHSSVKIDDNLLEQPQLLSPNKVCRQAVLFAWICFFFICRHHRMNLYYTSFVACPPLEFGITKTQLELGSGRKTDRHLSSIRPLQGKVTLAIFLTCLTSDTGFCQTSYFLSYGK